MQISEKWLRTIINPKINFKKLSKLLTLGGIEVQKIETKEKNIKKIIVGKILNFKKYNNIKICKINIGYIIFCKTNSKNIKIGKKILCSIKKKSLQGKLYSLYKLSLLENYNKKIIELHNSQKIGHFFFNKNIKDTILTINIPTNRPDCLYILGLAQEIKTLTKTKIKKSIKYKNIINIKEKKNIKILDNKILNNNLCYQTLGRIIKNLNINNLVPYWLKYRLKNSGKKSVSTITDILNYIILETGYYFNIFDLDKIKGNLNIRFAKKNEQINLFNSKLKIKNNSTIVISDKKNILSLSGIIFNKYYNISKKTKNIYIEITNWKKKIIRNTSKAYNIYTDSSKILEKGVNFFNISKALERITNLLVKICGISNTLIGPIKNKIFYTSKNKKIKLKIKNILKIIGINIKKNKIKKIFKKLNFKYKIKKNFFIITPPNYRTDLKIEEDLIEEIIRIYGYKNIPSIPPKTFNIIKYHSENIFFLHKIRNLVTNLGYQEVINYSFTSDKLETDFMKNKKQIKILNPISNNMNILRSSLIPNLIKNIQYNINYKINKIRLFEIGTVFSKNKNIKDSQYEIKGYKQEKYITCINYGQLFNQQWTKNSRNINFYDVKSDLENLFIKQKLFFIEAYHPSFHPQYSLKILLNNKQKVGYIGKIHPFLKKKYKLKFSPILFEIKVKSLFKKKNIKYKNISKFPEIIRDVSFITNKNIKVQSLYNEFEKIIKKNKLIKKITLLDQYQNNSMQKNEKSLTFRIIIQGKKNNLNNDNINSLINLIILNITKTKKIKLRYIKK